MKAKRDITLGEMQDECKATSHSDCINGVCPYYRFCAFRSAREMKPKDLDLTDPPRFSDGAMAFFRGWYAMGAELVKRYGDGHIAFMTVCGDRIGTIDHHFDLVDIMEMGETLDLAELLGEDGK